MDGADRQPKRNSSAGTAPCVTDRGSAGRNDCWRGRRDDRSRGGPLVFGNKLYVVEQYATDDDYDHHHHDERLFTGKATASAKQALQSAFLDGADDLFAGGDWAELDSNDDGGATRRFYCRARSRLPL